MCTSARNVIIPVHTHTHQLHHIQHVFQRKTRYPLPPLPQTICLTSNLCCSVYLPPPPAPNSMRNIHLHVMSFPTSDQLRSTQHVCKCKNRYHPPPPRPTSVVKHPNCAQVQETLSPPPPQPTRTSYITSSCEASKMRSSARNVSIPPPSTPHRSIASHPTPACVPMQGTLSSHAPDQSRSIQHVHKRKERYHPHPHTPVASHPKCVPMQDTLSTPSTTPNHLRNMQHVLQCKERCHPQTQTSWLAYQLAYHHRVPLTPDQWLCKMCTIARNVIIQTYKHESYKHESPYGTNAASNINQLNITVLPWLSCTKCKA